MPCECFPLLSVPAMSQAWMCIVRQSRAGLLLGNTICSARAISKCPLVVIPYVIAGVSPSPFSSISPWDLCWDICASARTAPALLSPRALRALNVPLHCQLLQQIHQRVPDSVPARGQDSPGSGALGLVWCPRASSSSTAPSHSRAASAEDARGGTLTSSPALSPLTNISLSAHFSRAQGVGGVRVIE